MWYELLDLDRGKVLNRLHCEEEMALLIRQLSTAYSDAYPSDLGLAILNEDESLRQSLSGSDVGAWAHAILARQAIPVRTGASDT